MDRLIKTLVLVALCLTSAAYADVLDSTVQYERAVRQNLGVSTSATSYISSTEIGDYLDEAVLTICKSLAVIRADKTATTTAYQMNYNFTSFDSLMIDIKGVMFIGRDTVKPLVYTPREKWPSPPVTNPNGREAPARWPSMYDFSRAQLFVYPPPIRTVDSIRVDAVLKPPALASNTVLTTIPTSYRHLILTYTTWLAATARQHPMLPVIFSRLQTELSAAGWKIDATGALMPLAGK